MKINTKANRILSYLSFILSGIMIFSPIHKSENIFISIVSMIITSALCLLLILFIFDRKKDFVKISCVSGKITAATALLLSTFCCLMLITETIKDVSFVTGKGVSLFYYIILSASILSVNLYLCLSHKKGIFRFLIISSILFAFLIFISLSGFATTKSFIFDRSIISEGVYSSISRGVLSGLFFTSDSALFFYCFDDFYRKNNNTIDRQSAFTAFFIALLLIISYNLSTCFIFGVELTKELSDPDYALAKLLPGIDFTEAISALRIVSFLIKSSVYILCSAKVFSKALSSDFFTFGKTILFQYLFLPAAAILLSVTDKNLEYGAFQSLIYPSVIILSFIFIVIYTFFQK